MGKNLHSLEVVKVTKAISDSIGSLADLTVTTQLKNITFADNEKITLNEVVIKKEKDGFDKPAEKTPLPFWLGLVLGFIIGYAFNL